MTTDQARTIANEAIAAHEQINGSAFSNPAAAAKAQMASIILDLCSQIDAAAPKKKS